MILTYHDKIVLVTGGTRGIGKQIADDAHELGATVLITGTKQEEIERLNIDAAKKNLKKQFFCVDFSNRMSIEKFIKALEVFDRIDVLINNAGINRLNYIDDVLTEDWDDMIAVNLSAPFLLIRYISVKMKVNSYGKILNIASIFSKISKEKRSVYSATKFGIHGLTAGVANDLSKFNILVNTVSPGFVLTDLTRKNLSEKEREVLCSQIPIKRMAQPVDISSVVMFLASELNSYVTGQNIIVDGGFVNV